MNGSRRSAVLVLLVLVAVTVPAVTAQAADWPQWRGPERDGKAPGQGLLTAWPEAGPPLAWRAAGLGGGYSSVAVAGERIYTMGDMGDALGVSRENT